jgi:hypothetical protein
MTMKAPAICAAPPPSTNRPDGEAVELDATRTKPVAEHFDAPTVKETNHGFCAEVAGAGCAGHLVSFTGKRVLYYGRTGEDPYRVLPWHPAGAQVVNAAAIQRLRQGTVNGL